MPNPYDSPYPAIKISTTTAPAAGLEFEVAPPTNTRANIIAIDWTLTTDATAVQRAIKLQLWDGANVLRLSPHFSTQGASLTSQYYASNTPPAAITGGTLEYWLPLPTPLILNPNWRILSDTDNLQAADQFSAIRIFCLIWPAIA